MRALTDVGSWRLSRVWRYTILSPMSCHGNCPLSQSSFTFFSPEFHTVNKKLHRSLRGHQCESFFHERCLKLSRWYLEAEMSDISFYNLPGSVYKCIYCCTRVCESGKVNLKTNYINVQKLERRVVFFHVFNYQKRSDCTYCINKTFILYCHKCFEPSHKQFAWIVSVCDGHQYKLIIAGMGCVFVPWVA